MPSGSRAVREVAASRCPPFVPLSLPAFRDRWHFRYRKLHAAVWPEVLGRIAASNIRNYTIFYSRGEGRAAIPRRGGLAMAGRVHSPRDVGCGGLARVGIWAGDRAGSREAPRRWLGATRRRPRRRVASSFTPSEAENAKETVSRPTQELPPIPALWRPRIASAAQKRRCCSPTLSTWARTGTLTWRPLPLTRARAGGGRSPTRGERRTPAGP